VRGVFGCVGEGRGCWTGGPGVSAVQAYLANSLHLWVGRLPHEGLHKGVWRVVMLAALLGMDIARQLLAKWRLQARDGQPVL
jgi:hypothetical protein